METYKLCFELCSAAAFGRGDGVAGLVDREVEHDAQGLPYVRGRTLRGLLAEECANLLPALRACDPDGDWEAAAKKLFGSPGSTEEDRGWLRVGDATLPPALCSAVSRAVRRQELTPRDVLESLTAIRRQTAINEQGAPQHRSLRSLRVVLPGAVFEATLLLGSSEAKLLTLLAACILAWRRGGTGRNRGRGRLRAWLCDEAGNDISAACFAQFAQEVKS